MIVKLAYSSQKWRWITVNICWAWKKRVRYPPLFTDTEVNNCLIYSKTVNSQWPKKMIFFWSKLGWKGDYSHVPPLCFANQWIYKQVSIHQTSGYNRLVYTKPVNSVFPALWLATQARDTLHYPRHKKFKMFNSTSIKGNMTGKVKIARESK